MVEICNICGLPKDLCVCDQISSQQRLVYVLEKRVKRAKFITEITGIDSQKKWKISLKI
jgi:translation initiation factor 1